jgi:hypothetical protein
LQLFETNPVEPFGSSLLSGKWEIDILTWRELSQGIFLK